MPQCIQKRCSHPAEAGKSRCRKCRHVHNRVSRARTRRKKARLECVTCTNRATPGHVHCEDCLAYKRLYKATVTAVAANTQQALLEERQPWNIRG